MDWSVRVMVDRDHSRYKQFIKQWITRIPVEKHFEWLYLNNPHGKAVTWIAIHASTQEIIGATSLFPKRIWLNGKMTKGCVGGDAFVSPDYRRRGIAKLLHTISLEEMHKYGLLFEYGFPNRPNFQAFLKAGALYPGNFSEIMFLLRTEPVIKKLHIGKRFGSMLEKIGDYTLGIHTKWRILKSSGKYGVMRKIALADSCLSNLTEIVASRLTLSCCRDSEYLNWRFFNNPAKAHEVYLLEVDNQPAGWTALEFNEKTCILFDFHANQDDLIVNRFIGEILKLAHLRGCSKVTMFLNPAGPYAQNFIRSGFKVRKKKRSYPMIVLSDFKGIDTNYLTDIKNWYLTHADLDLPSVGQP